jgi:hypothetical protein
MTSSDGPVFVVGAMRSGTTLLRLMLNRHSQLAIPAESHFFAALFERFTHDEVLSGLDLDEAVTIITSTIEWQQDWREDADALRDDLRPRAPMRLGALIDGVFRFETRPTGKPRWGSKTPAHLFQVPRLRRALPDARFIGIVRDPRDAYLSLAPRGWVGTDAWSVGRYLARCDRLVHQFHTDGHGDFTTVRYEQLVLDPEPELERLCDAVGLAYEPEMKDFHVDARQHVQDWEIQTGAHEKLLRPPSVDDVGRWRREGSRHRLREVEAVTYDAVRTFGYETTMPKWRASTLRRLAQAEHRLSRSSGGDVATARS